MAEEAPKRNLNLSVDDRKEKPFHCDECGDSYEPCEHWADHSFKEEEEE